MIQEQEQALLAAFRRMNEKQKQFTLGFVERFAPEKPQPPVLRLVVTQPQKH